MLGDLDLQNHCCNPQKVMVKVTTSHMHSESHMPQTSDKHACKTILATVYMIYYRGSDRNIKGKRRHDFHISHL